MYILMKDGKYFTGIIVPSDMHTEDTQADEVQHGEATEHEYLDFIAWSYHPSAAKVWEKNRGWADKAASRWGGKVIEIRDRVY